MKAEGRIKSVAQQRKQAATDAGVRKGEAMLLQYSLKQRAKELRETAAALTKAADSLEQYADRALHLPQPITEPATC